MKQIRRVKFEVDVEFNGPPEPGHEIDSDDVYPTASDFKTMETWIRESMGGYDPILGFTKRKRGVAATLGFKSMKVKVVDWTTV